ncbi:Bgt-3685 [Blumeria graminis f. sp. tritici]|uniref:FAD-binding domain-containing protein n=3 Tax=Blumeria graminis f. sp. tritici TaxID=62690 RepID=A0A656KKV8_BLUGR|nr:hypothetical protein BGT96224_3685 [Blumeria graminis f. sp. tritici 96224]VDB88312.1 Bgt-3685 [Blumeria graminis f. sp. tritici]
MAPVTLSSLNKASFSLGSALATSLHSSLIVVQSLDPRPRRPTHEPAWICCVKHVHAGQQIDIRGAGVQVIKRMGVEEAIRARTTREDGLLFIDANGRHKAEFPVRPGELSFTSEYEIVRESLVKVFFDATKANTEYIFGNHVTNLQQADDEKVSVTLDTGETRVFDLLIGADGMWSKIRKLAFPDIQDPSKFLGQYTSYFTIPYERQDSTYAKWYNAQGGRSILIRPDNSGCTRSFLSIISNEPAGYRQLSIPAQKAMMRRLFADAGWETERILNGMDKADDFYMQEIGQIRMPCWSRGRVVLLGDAGYCSSPISGMGTTLAIAGAYVLAGEISRAGKDFRSAFQGYESKMRPYVTKAQDLPPGVPAILNPQSKWGIKVFHSIIGLVAWSRIFSLVEKLSGAPEADNTFPNYEPISPHGAKVEPA